MADNVKDQLLLEGLSIDFGDFRAVERLSLSVSSGESFGLVGESGSGKSTVLRAIAGLEEASEGQIYLDGKPLGRTRTKAFRRDVQMVFQDPYGSLHPR